MDRDTLETLCQSFAARQSRGCGGVDPVPEIMRSFRLAEISAAEMQSLLGLVVDDEEAADLDALPGFDDALDPPPAIVDDFPDFDEIVAAGIVDDDDDAPLPLDGSGVVVVRIDPATGGMAVDGRSPPAG